jgi:hypothetical protein
MKKGKKNPKKKLESELWYSRNQAQPGEFELVLILDGLKKT